MDSHFAKAPVAGLAKTRAIPALGAGRAPSTTGVRIRNAGATLLEAFLASRTCMKFAQVAALALSITALATANAVPVVTAVGGANAAAISLTVDAYRASLGVLNPNVAGSFGSGRREINWDGVPDALAAPNNLPANFFNVNSPRGAVFSTPGSGFQVSANAAAGPVEFGNLNASYPSLFGTFSSQRLFTALGSTITDVIFFVPGSATPATVSGFGAVFTDVDLPQVSSLQFFDQNDALLGVFFVPAIVGNETLSFIGVMFTTERIGRVRITSGNQILGGAETGDLVVMDDFIYGEPVAVPEPATLALLLAGLGVVGFAARRKKT